MFFMATPCICASVAWRRRLTSTGENKLPISPFGVCLEVLPHRAVPAILLWIGGVCAIAVAVPEYGDQDELVWPPVRAQDVASHKPFGLTPPLLRPFIVHGLQLLLV